MSGRSVKKLRRIVKKQVNKTSDKTIEKYFKGVYKQNIFKRIGYAFNIIFKRMSK